ncbi:MAG TPA: chemotaxis protein CheB [Candidatus Acidoferrales bacterium]|nr:chemotaxis protein CheB [Candidatus Acidoferrales bacterium]
MKARRNPALSRSGRARRILSARSSFPVVAIGASAGGLDAVTQLVSRIPANSGIALVLVQHLSANHESSLVPLLSRVSKLAVSEVTSGLAVKANCMYVIPPGMDLVYSRGILRLKSQMKAHGLHMPVDRFMESLAGEKSHRTIGVVLSGTGSDGALGVQAIKAKGGITLAQSQESAKFDGMPRAAIATGCIDFVLSPAQIAVKLIRIARHPFRLRPPARRAEKFVARTSAGRIPRTGRRSVDRDLLAQMKRELEQTRARLEDVIRGHENTNAELQAANDDIFARNVELHSINQELEAAKKESQFTNHELTTLNQELEHRHSELSQLNSDLTNLFDSLEIPILILGRDLRIRRFSPAAEGLLHLMPGDVGRPVIDMNFSATIKDLRSDCLAVIHSGKGRERQMRDSGGRWRSLRISPYVASENKIEGAVVSLVDIGALKRASDAIEDARQYAEAVIEAVHESLLVLDSDLRVLTANRPFYKTFHASPKSAVGQFIYDLNNRQWNIPELRSLLEKIISHDAPLVDFELDREFPGLGRKALLLHGRKFRSPKSGAALILLAIQDETERRRAEVAAARSGMMSARLLRFRDEERRRVARELHDSTSQSMAGLMMNMNQLTRSLDKSDPAILATLAETRKLADESIREIRTISYLLHPPLLEEAGLASALCWFIDGFGKRSEIRVKLSLPPRLPRLAGDLELALFRVAQEALTNVHHHSGSTSARVALAIASGEVILEVSDRGKGLPPDVWKPDVGISEGAGVGIASMRERVRQLGGKLEIRSSARGTGIKAILPVIKR